MALALLTGPVIADDGLPYMATLSIERAADSTGALGASLASTLHVTEPQKTAAALSRVAGVDVIEVAADSVSIRFSKRPTLDAAPQQQHQQSSWVIDFEEASIQALLDELATATDARPTPAQLEAFVFDHIDNKSYSRSFDLASRVAASGEGDCTEHAVLLAALARAHGYAARVVFGSVLIEQDEGLYAFGHAWTEIHSDGAWQIVDATRPDNAGSLRQVRYIPLGSLDNEGPGYFLSLAETVQALPSRISGVRNP